MNIGDKVYVWSEFTNQMMTGYTSDEPIIGDVIDIEGEYIHIKSIVDDENYCCFKPLVHEVGSGPAIKEKPMLAYCDKIADTIRKALLGYDPDNIIGLVEGVKMDLHPEKGYFVSTKKTIRVSDMNGKWYKVTVEEDNA